MAIPDHPNNRKERYLAKIAGQAGATIPAHPHTREEMYLDAIANGGGGGGGGTLYRHVFSIKFSVTDDDGSTDGSCAFVWISGESEEMTLADLKGALHDAGIYSTYIPLREMHAPAVGSYCYSTDDDSTYYPIIGVDAGSETQLSFTYIEHEQVYSLPIDDENITIVDTVTEV